ncbi:MAG TPA: aminotransferase class V-fold PLP-dependent enzyme, partial [Candidatus Dormibacteraeota bacterium]|nr:aminotransferase class V-fold PLP-dependent enzyme [Candidatus Dormibacteraeota bacterium]
MSARIYLDHAATTPMIAEARDTYVQAFERDYNASSIHSEGRESHAKLDEARTRVANVLSLPRRLVRFTSGGSESDALAILGLARAHRRGKRRRILTGAIEHHAVLHACDALANEDFEIVILPVDSNGIIDEESYAAQLDERTPLVSIHLANNEIGVIEPIAALAARAHEAGAYLHCDAVQAARWLDLSLESLGADLLSLSGHKFGGPKGVGVLAMRSELPLEPLIFGGGQEFGLRAGTENLPAIVAFSVALERAAAQRSESA